MRRKRRQHNYMDIDQAIDHIFQSSGAQQWEQDVGQLKWVDRNSLATNCNLYARLSSSTSGLLQRLSDAEKNYTSECLKRRLTADPHPRLVSLISQLKTLHGQAASEFKNCVHMRVLEDEQKVMDALQCFEDWLTEDLLAS